MAEKKEAEKLSSELENRLDDLFGEDGLASGENRNDSQAQDYPLAELKSLVLSIDWEITDEVLDSFLRQVNDLKDTFEDDKVVLTFLQLLHSLGDYIKKSRAEAHPKTFKILNSVFARLETVVLAKGLTEIEKKKLLQAELSRYQTLKAQISRSKTETQPKQKTTSAKPQIPEIKQEKAKPKAEAQRVVDRRPEPSVETLGDAVKEIKAHIHAEIMALKEEIRLLQEQK